MRPAPYFSPRTLEGVHPGDPPIGPVSVLPHKLSLLPGINNLQNVPGHWLLEGSTTRGCLKFGGSLHLQRVCIGNSS